MMPISTRRAVLALAAAVAMVVAAPALAAPIKLRISTPAVESDWHAKMLTVFKDTLDKSAPGQFDVEIISTPPCSSRAPSPPPCSAAISIWR